MATRIPGSVTSWLSHRLVLFELRSGMEIILQMLLRRMQKFCIVFVFLALGQGLPGCAQPPPEPATEAKLLALIRAEVGDAQCESDQQCRTLAVGEKDCGGPEYWLAWSTKQSQGETLKARSIELAGMQRRRNEASGIRSNCRYMPDPGAVCLVKRCELKTSNNAN